MWLPIDFGEGGSMSIPCSNEWDLDRLAPYQRWSVATDLPDHVWLGDVGDLPAKVAVETSSGTTEEAVTWDNASISQPGRSELLGTLSGGRAFTRDIVACRTG